MLKEWAVQPWRAGCCRPASCANACGICKHRWRLCRARTRRIVNHLYVQSSLMQSLRHAATDEVSARRAPMKTMQGAESMASWNSCRTFASDSPATQRPMLRWKSSQTDASQLCPRGASQQLSATLASSVDGASQLQSWCRLHGPCGWFCGNRCA